MLKHMRFKMRTQLALVFALFALLLFAAASLSARVLFEKQFAKYTLNQQNKTVEKLISTTVHAAYANGQWSKEQLASVGMMALEEGMVYRFYDANTTLIWDARTHNNGFCVQMLDNMATNMATYKANFKGSYQENSYPVTIDDAVIGEIVLGYYGPYYYQDDALVFVKTVTDLLLFSGLIGLILALILGVCVANRLARPLKRLTKRAEHIAHGHYEKTETVLTRTAEIEGLYQSIERAATTLAAQDKLRKRLATDRAHEFRTPLMALRSQLELMMDGIWEADNTRLSSCLEEVEHLEKLSADMEKLAKSEGHCHHHPRTAFHLDEMVTEGIKRFESMAHSQKIQIIFEGHAGVYQGDRTCLSEAFTNLLSNAIKHTPQGGEVTIRTQAKDQEMYLEISDTGCGIDAADLPFVFERFYRSEVSVNRKIAGSGIGLSIVKQVIDAHHGSVSIESRIDEGTRVTIKLPIKD